MWFPHTPPPAGLSIKARPLLVGMPHPWGRRSLRPFLPVSRYSAVAVILMVLGSHSWFCCFLTPHPIHQRVLLTLTLKYAQNPPLHAAATTISPGPHLRFYLPPPSTLVPHNPLSRRSQRDLIGFAPVKMRGIAGFISGA